MLENQKSLLGGLTCVIIGITALNAASTSFSGMRAKRSLSSPCGGCPSNLLNATEKTDILNYHNLARKMVQPPAENMLQMMWDPDLADCDGQEYINQCLFAHGHSSLIDTCSADINTQAIGQNLYVYCSTSNIRPENFTGEAVEYWFREKEDYTYDTNTCASQRICGHYTQVAWANSFRLGCAYSACQSDQSPCGEDFPYYWILVCNYYPG
ncbi:peptidase inhibitor 16-like [Lingula anatina]|uniref:Peptidase inhibitor 16-like n=1 Tax=Lingula anatina TaxID=7574 RepID=A0A1S3K3Y9_LINAN|nr:peptidase inhibitor 16-like [Lingula anatina]|eukprot:XP_013417242.1 peptidase inhibitor 16-like [Lingula anatina]